MATKTKQTKKNSILTKEVEIKKERANLMREDFPVVVSLDNLEVGKIYTTYNHDLFIPLKFNRGEKMGYVVNRVKKFKEMIEQGDFYMDVAHVMVNMAKIAVDGNNRLQALKELNMPVNFIITNAEPFNVEDESEILNNVSEYNSTNNSWNETTNYKSALAYNEPVAVAIDETLTEIYNTYDIPKNVFTASRLIGLVSRKPEMLRKNKTRRVYCDVKLARKFKTNWFKKELAFQIKVALFMKKNNSNINSWNIIKEIMPLIWKYDLKLHVVLKNLRKKGFHDLANYKATTIKARCLEIVKMGNVV